MIHKEENVHGNLWTYYVYRNGIDAFISLSSETTGNTVYLYWFSHYDPTKRLVENRDYQCLNKSDHIRIANVPQLYFYGI